MFSLEGFTVRDTSALFVIMTDAMAQKRRPGDQAWGWNAEEGPDAFANFEAHYSSARMLVLIIIFIFSIIFINTSITISFLVLNIYLS